MAAEDCGGNNLLLVSLSVGIKFSFSGSSSHFIISFWFHMIAADLLASLASFVTRHEKFFLLVFPSSSARGNNDNRSKLKIVDAFTPRNEKKCVSLRGILILHVTLFQHACHIF